MADVPVLNAAEGADVAPSKSKKWLIIGIAAFLVLAGGGAAAYQYLGPFIRYLVQHPEGRVNIFVGDWTRCQG